MAEDELQWERHNRDFNADAIRNQQATCEHKWDDVSGWGGCASGTRQCRRCNKVLSAGTAAPTPPDHIRPSEETL